MYFWLCGVVYTEALMEENQGAEEEDKELPSGQDSWFDEFLEKEEISGFSIFMEGALVRVSLL
jgi:hypothetical protein